MQAKYEELSYLISSKTDFRGNSCKGVNSNGTYKVFSYTTLIYEIDEKKKIYFNNNYYSSTTSRLQNIICRILGRKEKRDEKEKIYT